MQNASSFTSTTTDVLAASHSGLDAIFAPKNVAVIGATERPGSVGRTILWNLISNPFGGAVFPVNPGRSNVLGIRAYPNIAAVPEQVDLAVVVTPAHTVPGVIKECVDVGITGAIIISAGFKERGPEGVALEAEIAATAQRGNMRIIGPNCLGVMRPLSGLNATFASAMARPGNVGFISQSGALCTSVLDWSFKENVGFSAFISVGSMLDVGWGDLIDYLGQDPNTHSIVIYMESVGDARSFLSASREVALKKPIIVIKAGRTEAAAQAAASHTGSLTGSDEVLEAAFRRVGVLRVERIADVFYMAEVLAKQPRPRGPRLTIITNAGGPGVLATDSLISGGGELAPLSDETLAGLNEILPAHWSHGNPVDVLGDAGPELYAKSIEAAAKDPNSDGLLVILTPQAMSDPTRTAELMRNHAQIEGKPVLASWMGGPDIAAGETILNRAGVPTFAFPDTATRMFNYMWRFSENLRTIYETPNLPVDSSQSAPDREVVRAIIDQVRASGRTILTEYESKQVLAAYHISTVPTLIAATAEDAVGAADQIGYPVVLKLNSETITHKTDVGGVILNLPNAGTVRDAFTRVEAAVTERAGAEHFQGVTVQPMVRLDGYELIIGSSIDPQFGPVLLFGTGGSLVEVFKDRALGLPPLNTTLARRMMEQTRIYEALHGVRGRPPVDLAALEMLMVRFSQLVVEQPWIKEIDINPLLASPDQLLALDARVVLHDPTMTADQLPRPAIRPYPIQYVQDWTSKGGTPVKFRPILPEDEPLIARFHETLSERSVFMRYLKEMNLSQRVGHERLSRLSFIDYDREIALVAERRDPQTSDPEIMGVARLTKIGATRQAEFAILVNDRFQHQGLGTELMRRLLQMARDEQMKTLFGNVLDENVEMQQLVQKLGFTLHPTEREHILRATMDL
ncbi:MAG: bifunctional acetate--CoA ligase family protein/GNAT family N-acetyltransferase [Chloroflexi bacterium]|nr:bifunctional acetate--CoA ligase family protein/GNAT family N-acetyltransferase [Chloroflexota bacterium]